MKTYYSIMDTASASSEAFEVKSDREARMQSDGTAPLLFDTLEEAAAVCKSYRGMTVVQADMTPRVIGRAEGRES